MVFVLGLIEPSSLPDNNKKPSKLFNKNAKFLSLNIKNKK
jgi:hypothetical protein